MAAAMTGDNEMAQTDATILFLSDRPGGVIGQDLDLLYPRRVKKLDFTLVAHDLSVLRPFRFVVTAVHLGRNLPRLDYAAVTEFARGGGQVVSSLLEYGHHRGLHFSKAYVGDRMRPGMSIAAECDVTRGFAVGDSLWWYGCVSSAPDSLYSNQMLQRQIMNARQSDGVRILGTSTVNGAAVMIEEKLAAGRIVAMDIVTPGRPFFNSRGSTNKYLFLGNIIGNSVRYGKHYPTRLCYDDFVDEMRRVAARHPRLRMQSEGPCSDGRPMWTLNLGDEKNPRIYFGAAVHGWEWENSYGLLRLAELLCEQPDIEGLDTNRLHFKIMPVQNPYGFDHFTRHNARGVDLNRNFDFCWDQFEDQQDIPMPWDYSYKGASPGSERETQIIQGIFDRYRPMCVIDFHTADYIMMLPHKGDKELLAAIHAGIKARLKDRYITQKPYGGAYQQVNMDKTSEYKIPEPYLIYYAAERGAAASFLIEMSGNRDDVHALVMNTDTVVEICLAAVKECLAKMGS